MDGESGNTVWNVSIAGLNVALACNALGHSFNDVVTYRSIAAPSGKPNILLRVHLEDASYHKASRVVFELGDIGRLYSGDDELILDIGTGTGTKHPFPPVTAIIKPDLSVADLYIGHAETHTSFPFLKQALENVLMALMPALLCSCQGLLVHASGVVDGESCSLFVGPSGSGKTTMIDLWRNREKAIVAWDGHTALRKNQDDFLAYGIPWYGDLFLYGSPTCIPVRKVFLVKHSKRNKYVRLRGIEAITRLLANSLPTFWDQLGMSTTLELITELIEKVHCYVLGFVPDENIIDFLRDMDRNGEG
jgi:hypothetical protein